MMDRMTCAVITGPTASGKSDLAMVLAEKLRGEIVCMDSMQIYRRMNIGTAKPTEEEQERVAHHMLDVADPTEAFSVAQYKQMAYACAREVLNRGNLPIFCGGTGFYLRALRYDMTMGGASGDPAVRAALEREAEELGPQKLHDRLKALDRVTADRLHVNDVRRVVRALEVIQLTGRPFSEQQPSIQKDDTFHWVVFCMDMDRTLLYERINLRVDRMLKMGLEDEVRGLIFSGVTPECQSMQGIGYKEWIPYLAGAPETSPATVAEEIRLNTRHYAKRQLTWMRREENVMWLDPRDRQTVSLARDAILKAQEETPKSE